MGYIDVWVPIVRVRRVIHVHPGPGVLVVGVGPPRAVLTGIDDRVMVIIGEHPPGGAKLTVIVQTAESLDSNSGAGEGRDQSSREQ